MKPFSSGPIDKRLAHKTLEANVFVCDLRRAIPALIHKDTVETAILPQLTPMAQEQFLGSYIATTAADGTKGYSLSMVPRRLPKRLLSAEEGASPFSPAERRTLERFFIPDEIGEWYERLNNISEMEDVILGHILQKSPQAMATEDLIGLANLLEGIPGYPTEQVFHAGIRVDTSHPFFFEHHNEHVPGMMVVEAARQFAMACWHRFGGVPLHGYQFILNQLHAEFYDYLDLNYPSELKAEVRDLAARKSGEWETATVTVTVTQGQRLCAQISFPSQVVSKRSFQRLRSGRTKTDHQHRFQPFPSIHYKLSLWNTESQKYQDCTLVDLSMEGLGALAGFPWDEHSSPSSWELLLYFEEVGFVRLPSTLVWKDPRGNGVALGFRFRDASAADRAQLQAVIRQCCHIRKERERL